MSNKIQPLCTTRLPGATRKTLANSVRNVLIVVNCLYGIHLAAGFANTTSISSPSTHVNKSTQPVSLVPVAGRWNFKPDADQSRSNLLPLPQGARTLCNRIGSDGSVQMEIIELSTSRSQLLERWQFAGWNVRLAPHQRSGGTAWFCRRGDKFVYAWSASKSDRIESLMLVNDPPEMSIHSINRLENDHE